MNREKEIINFGKPGAGGNEELNWLSCFSLRSQPFDSGFLWGSFRVPHVQVVICGVVRCLLLKTES